MRSYKKLISIFAIVTAFIGCGKDETTINNPPPAGGAFTLSGTISGYPGGSLIAKAMINKFSPPDSFYVGADTVDNNAALSMSLVTPPTDFLVPIIVPSGINVSDTTCRISSFGELHAYNFSSIMIGHIAKKNYDDTVVQGSFSMQFLYCTKAVTIMGGDTAINLTDTTITVYNINAVSGWNAFTIKLDVQRPDYSQYSYTSGETGGATWRYMTMTVPLTSRMKLY
jgi:hypothetical protein